MSDDSYTVQNLIAGIKRAGPPVVQDGFIIFTADKASRHVGIAFDFEDFKTVHSFERIIFYDSDYEPVDSMLFYVTKIPKNKDTLAYRLIIDGLWTIDPLNKNTCIDKTSHIKLSLLPIQEKTVQVTKKTDSGSVRFVFEGESGQKIRLTGSFTGWDPYIYELNETSRGFYELNLHLPPGTYYYNFYKGLSSFIDEKNPERAYTKDGRVASILVVN